MSGLGYSIGRNKPYAGGFITEHYGNPASGLHTIQLELNRAIYMDERRRERGAALRAGGGRLRRAGGGAGRRFRCRSRAVPGGGGVASSFRAATRESGSDSNKPEMAAGSAHPGMTMRPKKKGPLE